MPAHRVTVGPFPEWFPALQLLGEGDWALADRCFSAELSHHAAADLDARLRKMALCGRALDIRITPKLSRTHVRAARTQEARRRRDTTPGFTRPGVRLDEQGRFSLTPESLASKLGARAQGRPIIDACCGAGGNTIGFARAGSPVIAVELDAARLQMARHNARVYGVSDCIRFLEGDVLDLLGRMPQEGILFVDPPWGPDYRSPSRLADHPILAALVSRWQGAIWAKLPPAFDPDSWPDASPEAWFGEAAGDARRVKFLVLRRRG